MVVSRFLKIEYSERTSWGVVSVVQMHDDACYSSGRCPLGIGQNSLLLFWI